MTVAGQAFILVAAVFVLSFVAIAAIWLADRWRRGSGQQWTTTPKGPVTNRWQVNFYLNWPTQKAGLLFCEDGTFHARDCSITLLRGKSKQKQAQSGTQNFM